MSEPFCDCLTNPPPLGVNTPAAGSMPDNVSVAPQPLPTQFVWKVLSGDQSTLTARLTLRDGVTPATPDNSLVVFTLAETQFSCRAIWVGGWDNGVVATPTSGLVTITIPARTMDRLRRGSYMFTIRVTDRLGTNSYTAINGSMLLEYTVGGPQHDIPYVHPNPGEYQELYLLEFTGKIFFYAENGIVRSMDFLNGMQTKEGETFM